MAMKRWTEYPDDSRYPEAPFVTVMKKTGMIRCSRPVTDALAAKKATHVWLGWDGTRSIVGIGIADPSEPGAIPLTGGIKPGVKGPQTFTIKDAGHFLKNALGLPLVQKQIFEVDMVERSGEFRIEFDPTRPWGATATTIQRGDRASSGRRARRKTAASVAVRA